MLAICINNQVSEGHYIHISHTDLSLRANNNDGIYYRVLRIYEFEKQVLPITHPNYCYITYPNYCYIIELGKGAVAYMDQKTFHHCFKEI